MSTGFMRFDQTITDTNYEEALAEADRMMHEHWRNPTEDLALQLDELAAAIQAYEDITYPFPEPTPAESHEHLTAERERSPMYYIANITQDGTTWLAQFPDAPGCQTEADTLEALPSIAQEALEGWLEAHVVDALVPPKPQFPEGPNTMKVPVRPSLAAALALRWLALR